MKKNFLLFVGIPFFFNFLTVFLYFCGSSWCQQIIAPTIEFLSENSWREFGLLEQLQNVFLMLSLAVVVKAVFTSRKRVEKLILLFVSFFFLFVLLEEIDCGIHFVELVRGESSGITYRNWHNVASGVKQNVVYLKMAAQIFMVLWFFFMPLFKKKLKNQNLRAIVPSIWFIPGYIIAVAATRTALFLESMGYGFIEGVPGNLTGNISEFTETSIYYFIMLYTVSLIKKMKNNEFVFKYYFKNNS